MAAITCQKNEVRAAPTPRLVGQLLEKTYFGSELKKERVLANYFTTDMNVHKSRQVRKTSALEQLTAPSRPNFSSPGGNGPEGGAKPYLSSAPTLLKAASKRFNADAAIVLTSPRGLKGRSPKARRIKARKPRRIRLARGKVRLSGGIKLKAGGKKSAGRKRSRIKGRGKVSPLIRRRKGLKARTAKAKVSRALKRRQKANRRIRGRSIRSQISKAVRKLQDNRLRNRIKGRPVARKERLIVLVPQEVAKSESYQAQVRSLKRSELHPWKGITEAPKEQAKLQSELKQRLQRDPGKNSTSERLEGLSSPNSEKQTLKKTANGNQQENAKLEGREAEALEQMGGTAKIVSLRELPSGPAAQAQEIEIILIEERAAVRKPEAASARELPRSKKAERQEASPQQILAEAIKQQSEPQLLRASVGTAANKIARQFRGKNEQPEASSQEREPEVQEMPLEGQLLENLTSSERERTEDRSDAAETALDREEAAEIIRRNLVARPSQRNEAQEEERPQASRKLKLAA